ncbi:MAG: hypothetical protein HS107_04140 [Thermoflexaceae bacterium]|nr:hypothetical protein [Thermoflexaceae bacterium]
MIDHTHETSPYPPGEGPVFHCTRTGPGGAGCDWLGFPAESDRCPLRPDPGRHRYEPRNFNPLSFQPLWNYASRCGFWLYPADFMAMGCRARYIDGAEVVLFAYKDRQSRNYLHVDDHGYSAWTTGAHPEPIPPSRAIQHATGMDHRHDDGCLNGSRVVTLPYRRKAG